MKKIIVGMCAAAALLVSAGARSEAVVIGYDVLYGLSLPKNGVWSSFYTGTQKSVAEGYYAYSGGSGTLNDGLVPANGGAGNMRFNISKISPKGVVTGYGPTITLHLSEVTMIDNVNFSQVSLDQPLMVRRPAPPLLSAASRRL